jgi:Photosynthesis system II assembly factor YCF48
MHFDRTMKSLKFVHGRRPRRLRNWRAEYEEFAFSITRLLQTGRSVTPLFPLVSIGLLSLLLIGCLSESGWQEVVPKNLVERPPQNIIWENLYPWLFDIWAVDDSTAWAVGKGGTILRTTDAGKTWRRQPSGISSDLEAIAGNLDGSQLWAVGDAGVVLHSSDRGQTWKRQSSGTAADLTSVQCDPDGSHLWVLLVRVLRRQ